MRESLTHALPFLQITVLTLVRNRVPGDARAVVRQERVRIVVLLVRIEMLGVGQLPFGDVVEVGEKRVAFELRVDAREVHPVGAMNGLLENLRAAGDERLLVPSRWLNPLLERVNHERALDGARGI